MRIYVTSVFVDDQRKALDFYTNTLGFQKKTRHPPRGGFVADRGVAGTARRHASSCSSPPAILPSSPYKDALVEDGIPATSFAVDDIHAEHHRLRSNGVRFTQEPTEMGGVTTAVFDDTCGNLIQIVQMA